MISTAAFSLGFYIGGTGWSIQAPSAAGSEGLPGGQQPRNPGQQQGLPGQQFQPGGQQQPGTGQQPRADLVGIILSVTDDSLEIETREGFRMVQLTEATFVSIHENNTDIPAELSDLEPGVRVAVFGQFDDAGQTLTARLVVIVASDNQ